MPKTFQSLQRQHLPEQVARAIGLSIMRQDFKAGDVLLSEPELSLQFHVSRTVLREALKVLGKKGLIESRPKLGTRVRPREDWNLLDADVIDWQYEIGPDKNFLEAVCEVRLMFEPMAARFAAARATKEEIETIVDYCQRMQEGIESSENYISNDLQFHAAIYAATHNPLLQQIMATLAASLRSSRLVTSHLPGANLAAMPAHQAVTEAIRMRDEQTAEEAMRKLVIATTEDIQQTFGYFMAENSEPASNLL
ncbi:MAG: FadR/GntR family transcriptional regulator [Ktedonobacteraceae bacterium]